MAALHNIRSFLRSPLLWTFAVKGANALSSFAVTILLARIAGAEIVGQYALAFATAMLVGLLPLCGLDIVALRKISGDLRENKNGEARGTARWMLNSVFLAGLLATLLFAAAVFLGPVADRLEADHRALLAAAVGVLAVPLFRLSLNSVRALGMPVWGQFFEALPSVGLAAMLLVMAFGAMVPPLWLVVLLMFGGQLASSGLAFLLFRKSVQGWSPPVRPDAAETRALLLAGLPIMGTALLHQFSDWFLLAATTGFANAAETGAFRASLQIMMMVMVICITAETYVSPRIGGDLRAGQVELAWRRHRRATVLMVGIASPILLLAVLAPDRVMVTLFGAEFATAGPALRIMAIGQLLNAITGPIGSMMIMAGKERIQLLLAIGGTVVLVLLGLALIPLFGLEGAALAYSGALIFRNFVGYVLARKMIRPAATTSDTARN